jgi:hypothetical protein
MVKTVSKTVEAEVDVDISLSDVIDEFGCLFGDKRAHIIFLSEMLNKFDNLKIRDLVFLLDDEIKEGLVENIELFKRQV